MFLRANFLFLPTHWPTEGRIRVAPIPAPIEAKIRDALHLTVARKTFCLRSLILTSLLKVSFFDFDLKNWNNPMPTWTSHDAETPSMYPIHKYSLNHQLNSTL